MKKLLLLLVITCSMWAQQGGVTQIPTSTSGGGTGCIPSSTIGKILTDSGSGTCTSSTPTISGSTITASITGHASLDAPVASPTFTGTVTIPNGGIFGTPTSMTATNVTGLPVSTGVSGLGTGIATALAINTGSAGAPVLLNGALGTPSSGTGTNLTGIPLTTGISGKLKFCTVIIGDPGSASPALANDNDSPVACDNDTGVDWTITTVACWADAGTPTITPILTGGTGTSILTGALTCGTAAWASGTVNGSPTVHSFSGAGATCSSTPCSSDVNITTAGGTAKYIVVKIVGTY